MLKIFKDRFYLRISLPNIFGRFGLSMLGLRKEVQYI
jgi:hypothetical protein